MSSGFERIMMCSPGESYLIFWWIQFIDFSLFDKSFVSILILFSRALNRESCLDHLPNQKRLLCRWGSWEGNLTESEVLEGLTQYQSLGKTSQQEVVVLEEKVHAKCLRTHSKPWSQSGWKHLKVWKPLGQQTPVEVGRKRTSEYTIKLITNKVSNYLISTTIISLKGCITLNDILCSPRKNIYCFRFGLYVH